MISDAGVVARERLHCRVHIVVQLAGFVGCTIRAFATGAVFAEYLFSTRVT